MSPSDTRTAILDAAQNLIRRVGANGMSYRDVSDAVGIRKASIHHHFPSKRALIEALLVRYNDAFLGQVDALRKSGTTGREQLLAFANLFEQALDSPDTSHVCLCGMLAAEIETHGETIARHIRTFYRRNAKHLVAILSEGRSDGSLEFEGDAKALGVLIFSLLEGAMLTARADGGLRQFRTVKRQLIRLVAA